MIHTSRFPPSFPTSLSPMALSTYVTVQVGDPSLLVVSEIMVFPSNVVTPKVCRDSRCQSQSFLTSPGFNVTGTRRRHHLSRRPQEPPLPTTPKGQGERGHPSSLGALLRRNMSEHGRTHSTLSILQRM